MLDGLALTAADLSAGCLDTSAQLDLPGDLPKGSVGGQLLHDFDGELAIAHTGNIAGKGSQARATFGSNLTPTERGSAEMVMPQGMAPEQSEGVQERVG